MKVTIELDKSFISAMADVQAHRNAYDRMTEPEVDGNLTEQYANAWYDGAIYIFNLLNEQNHD